MMTKLKSQEILLKMCALANLKLRNTNLNGFGFSQNLLLPLKPSKKP